MKVVTRGAARTISAKQLTIRKVAAVLKSKLVKPHRRTSGRPCVVGVPGTSKSRRRSTTASGEVSSSTPFVTGCSLDDVGNSPGMVERKQKPKGQRKLEVRRAKVEAEREELRMSKLKARTATLQNSVFRSILRCDDKTTRDDRLTRERDHFGRFLSPSPARGLAVLADFDCVKLAAPMLHIMRQRCGNRSPSCRAGRAAEPAKLQSWPLRLRPSFRAGPYQCGSVRTAFVA